MITTLILALLASGPSQGQQQPSSQSEIQPQPVPSDPATLPLLGDDDIHLYVQEAYEVFSPVITSAVAARHAELVGAGMDTARHLFDWELLELSPGVYDTQYVIDEMDARSASGITNQFCNVVVIDTLDLTVPAYIDNLLASGVSWDDPQITTAFADLLDVFIPLMLERGMYMLGLTNEPGSYYEDFPGQAATFKGFVESAVEHAHALNPELSCTVVFEGPQDAAIGDLMPLLDIASFNQYFYHQEIDPTCLLGGSFALSLFRSSAPCQVGVYLDDLISAAQGKLICIQEMGQSTGWGDMPVSLGSLGGLENQRACFEALEAELDARREHFRTVCIWLLNDHTLEGIRYLGQAFIDAGFPACYAYNLMEIFGPAGLVHSDATASKKPAFDQFKSSVTFFAQ